MIVNQVQLIIPSLNFIDDVNLLSHALDFEIASQYTSAFGTRRTLLRRAQCILCIEEVAVENLNGLPLPYLEIMVDHDNFKQSLSKIQSTRHLVRYFPYTTHSSTVAMDCAGLQIKLISYDGIEDLLHFNKNDWHRVEISKETGEPIIEKRKL